jgi:hypothetical protein
MFPIWVVLALSMGYVSSVWADELPAPVPGKRTFEEFKRELSTLKQKEISNAAKKEITAAEQMVEKGMLMLLAGRISTAGMIAEQMALHFRIIRLIISLDALRAEAARKEKAIEASRMRLDALRHRLDVEEKKPTPEVIPPNDSNDSGEDN